MYLLSTIHNTKITFTKWYAEICNQKKMRKTNRGMEQVVWETDGGQNDPIDQSGI